VAGLGTRAQARHRKACGHFRPRRTRQFHAAASTLKRGVFAYPGRRDTIKSCGYVGELVRTMLFARDLDHPELTYNYAYPPRYTSQDICDAFHDVAGYARPGITIPLGRHARGRPGLRRLGSFGIKTSVNRLRVLKLVRSTNIVPKRLLELDTVSRRI